jgi:transposase
MSLRPQVIYLVPEETARVARAAFPKGTIYMRMYDALGSLFADQQFADLFPARGQAAAAPVRLALATILQFAEGLSDRQAADAVRGRIDWKYLLCLPLTDPGFDHTVLSEFRTRLVAGGAEHLLLDTLLTQFRELGLLKARGRQRTDSTHVLAAVRVLNRLERVGETLRSALNSLAVVAPDWLQAWVPAEWYLRYGDRIENYHLPKPDSERQALAATIGADGFRLLQMIDTTTDRPWLRDVPAVHTLRRVWAEQYTDPPGPVRWREVKDLAPVAELIASPYDIDARWSTKRSVEWVGYKVHLTETCDADLPRLITHVATTPATTPDDNMLAPIHAALAALDLLPQEHLVDAGYTNADALVTSEQVHGITVVGPVALDPSWQARAGEGFDKASFVVDWDAERVTCPAGKHSLSWLPCTDPTKLAAIHVRFARRDCLACPLRSRCTKAKIEPRELMLQTREEYEALQAARQRQATAEFTAEYAARAGVESAHSQGIRRCGLRQARYIGLPKVHLQHVLTAAALNVVRVGAWLAEAPLAKTRVSSFARLKAVAA